MSRERGPEEGKGLPSEGRNPRPGGGGDGRPGQGGERPFKGPGKPGEQAGLTNEGKNPRPGTKKK